MAELLVVSNGELMGTVEQGRNGDLKLTYERSWRERGDSYPLSLSMPLARREHDDSVVRPFLEGLLPDNNAVLESWARTFQVSARNPFALLGHMGEDCAGAAQFVRPDRYEAVSNPNEGEIEWLTEGAVAERLRDLVERHGTGRLAGDRGYFSLAGAQPKMPLLYDGERWGIPSGSMPTTHILKPPAQRDLEGFDINEHLCLRLARELGLRAAESRVWSFAGQETLVVERYDRQRLGNGRLIRLHQAAYDVFRVSPPPRHYRPATYLPSDTLASWRVRRFRRHCMAERSAGGGWSASAGDQFLGLGLRAPSRPGNPAR